MRTARNVKKHLNMADKNKLDNLGVHIMYGIISARSTNKVNLLDAEGIMTCGFCLYINLSLP